MVISEVEKENWGLGGVPADEKFPDSVPRSSFFSYRLKSVGCGKTYQPQSRGLTMKSNLKLSSSPTKYLKGYDANKRVVICMNLCVASLTSN